MGTFGNRMMSMAAGIVMLLAAVLMSACAQDHAVTGDAGTTGDGGATADGGPGRDGGPGPVADGGPTPIQDSGPVYPDVPFPDPPGPSRPCRAMGVSTADPTEAIEIGDGSGTGFTSYGDREEVPFEWGPQGGAMTRPILRFVAGDRTDAAICAQIELSNVGGDGDFPYYGEIEFVLVGDHYETEALLNQMSWDDPTGREIMMMATVRAVDFAGTGAVTIVVRSATMPPPR